MKKYIRLKLFAGLILGSQVVNGTEINQNAVISNSFWVNNTFGYSRVESGVSDADSGYMRLRDNGGGPAVFAGTSTADGDGRHGGLWVYDWSDTAKAGINGYTGDVWGVSKSFIVPHPENEELMIRYASLEGGDAKIFSSGKALLENGSARIAFPEHFTVLAAPDSVVVSITPASADSLGVAVTESSVDGFTVSELYGGGGAYEVHYIAHATRNDLKDRPVYLNRTEQDLSQRNAKIRDTYNGATIGSFMDYLPNREEMKTNKTSP